MTTRKRPPKTVSLMDWDEPDNNDIFLASQFWISGDYGKKRADLVGSSTASRSSSSNSSIAQ